MNTIFRVRIPRILTVILALAFFPAAGALAGEVVNLSLEAGLVENVAKDGPEVALGNGMPGTVTAASVIADAVSNQGPVLNLHSYRCIRFDDPSAFAFLKSGTFTYSARLLVGSEPADGSSFILNHWTARPEPDRSIAIRLVAQGGLVRPQVVIRHDDDLNSTTIEPAGVNWPVGQWVNFAVVADKSMLSFWVDGVQSPTSYEIPAMRSSMLPVFVGGIGLNVDNDPGLDVQLKNLKILSNAADEAWIKAQAAAK